MSFVGVVLRVVAHGRQYPLLRDTADAIIRLKRVVADTEQLLGEEDIESGSLIAPRRVT